MSDPRQRTIIKVSFHPWRAFIACLHPKSQVFRKYSHALGPDALDFLEDALDKHDIRDEDVEYSVDLIAKEYNKQDGELEPKNPIGSRFDSATLRRRHESVGRGPTKGVPTLAGVVHRRELDRTGHP